MAAFAAQAEPEAPFNLAAEVLGRVAGESMSIGSGLEQAIKRESSLIDEVKARIF